jgi:hypothetical protein
MKPQTTPEFKKGDYISVQGSLVSYASVERLWASRPNYLDYRDDSFINNTHLLILSIESFYYVVLVGTKIAYVPTHDFENAALLVIS